MTLENLVLGDLHEALLALADHIRADAHAREADWPSCPGCRTAFREVWRVYIVMEKEAICRD